MTDLTNLLADIRGRAEAATEGPWTATEYDHNPGDQGVPIIGGGEVGSMEGHLTAYTMTLSDEAQSIADATFIAHARTDVPRLLAALEGVVAACDAIIDNTDGHKPPGPPHPTREQATACRIRAAVVAALGREA